jgi:serine/threonine-protein kinase RIO1
MVFKCHNKNVFSIKNQQFTKKKLYWWLLEKDKSSIYFFSFKGPDDAEVPLNIPKEVAIKVFKTTLNEFKNRDKYIRDDYRFRDRFSKQNPRKVNFLDVHW